MRVSVIMPCYNAAPWIGVALRSLLNQTHVPAEIIVADDGSTDESAEIAEAFGPPVRVLRLKNGGAARARKAGAAEASGDALMFMDADDLIAPNTLAAQVACLEQNPDAISLAPWFRYERVNETVWLPRPASCTPRGHRQDDLQAWLSGWYHPPCSVLWSRSAYDRSGGWDEDVAVNQDGDIMMRGLIHGNRLILSETGAAFYRRLPGETPTISGGRSTRRGVVSRLDVLDRITAMLMADDRLEAYSSELATAYKAVKESCPEDFDDLQGRIDGTKEALPAAQPRQVRKAGLRTCSAPGSPSGTSWRPATFTRSPAVSVVIPTWNRGKTVLNAIQSVLDQSFRDFELIVVDDASTDDTEKRVRAVNDRRVRLVRQSVNGGVAAARNRGIAEAKAPLIALLDSDDLWKPGKLKAQVSAMRESNANVGVIYTGIENRAEGAAEHWAPWVKGYAFRTLLQVNALHGLPSTGLFRKEVFDMVGGFDTSFPAIEDYEMWVRIARFWEFDFVPATLASYYDDSSSDAAGLRRSRNLKANNEGRDLFHQRFAEDMRAASVEHEFLLESARRRAEEGRLARFSAARSILKAIRYTPRASKLYGWLPLILLRPEHRDRIVERMRTMRGPPGMREENSHLNAN